jgi:uncharacterized membrane protein YeaQ/YmgE (transglycosylase-associated protein family)
LFNVLVVTLVGIIGGIAHIFLFKDGKFYKPETFVDDDGRAFRDYGFLKELFVGIIAAFIATVPTWAFVPLPYKIMPALFASITGGSFVMNAAKNFLNKQKEQREEELENIVVKKKPKKQDKDSKNN